MTGGESRDAMTGADPGYILRVLAMRHTLQELHSMLGDTLFPAAIDAAAHMTAGCFGAAEAATFLRKVAARLDGNQERPH